MRTITRAGLGLALALAMLALAVHAQGVYVSPPHCWWYWQVNATYAVLYNYGTEAYTIYLMTPSEFNALYHYEGTYALGSWVLQPQSSIAIQTPSIGDYIVIALNSASCPSEPTVYMHYGYGTPIGVSSFEAVNTTEVLGFFNITAMSAYNPVGESEFGVPNTGVSLQLNVILEVQLTNGATQYYWLQNTVGFVTDSDEYSFEDDVWNTTSEFGVLSPTTVTGYGGVGPTPHGYSYGYTYIPPNQQYSLPLAGYLLIRLVSTNPLEVSFCYAIIQMGSQYYPPSFNCYDNVTISTPQPVASAAIVTYPGMTPSYNAIDTELVFGGYAYGEYTTFTSMNTYLALMYWDGSEWVPYGDLYMNGWDTAETATNLVSTALPNGFIYVSTGSLPSNGSSTFLAGSISTPVLPMTYVSILNTASNETWSGYVTSPVTYTFPQVIVNGSVEYVLSNVTVNGEPASSSTVAIAPSNSFTSFSIVASYKKYYLISVSSLVPITVSTYNESVVATSFTEWLPSGSIISIAVPGTYTFSNGTRLVYLGSNESITVDSPMSLVINQFTRQYLVSVASQYPISVNGTETTQFIAWASPGTTITIAPTTIFINGVFMSEPGYSITVNGPVSLTVQWGINWLLTAALYVAIALVVIAAAITARRWWTW